MFMNVSLSALTLAVLRHPVDSLRALPEAIRCDPGAFTEMPEAVMTRIEMESVAARDRFMRSDSLARFLRFFR